MLESLMRWVSVGLGHILLILGWGLAMPFRKTSSVIQGEGFGVIWYQCSWRLKLTIWPINPLIMPMWWSPSKHSGHQSSGGLPCWQYPCALSRIAARVYPILLTQGRGQWRPCIWPFCTPSSLGWFHLYPFPVISCNHEYNSFQRVWWPSSELSNLRVIRILPELVVSIRSQVVLRDHDSLYLATSHSPHNSF